MIAARTQPAARPAAIVAVVGAALGVRVLLGGAAPAASAPAAVAFVAVLGLAALPAARRPRVAMAPVALGAAGGAALVLLSLAGVPAVRLGARAPATALLWWTPLVTAVAAAEELVLRGTLFTAVRERAGDAAAVAVGAAVFAAIHLPLYGLPALGVDLCAGVFLGCLRVAAGSVTAPLIAHVVADVAGGWVG